VPVRADAGGGLMSVSPMRRALLTVGELMGVDYDEDMPADDLCEQVIALVTEKESEYRNWKRLYNDYVQATGSVPGRQQAIRKLRLTQIRLARRTRDMT